MACWVARDAEARPGCVAYEGAQAGKKHAGQVPMAYHKLLHRERVYRHGLERTPYRDFAMGEIGMAAMRANHVGAVLQIDVGDGAWVGGRAPGPKSSPRRPCRPPRPTWTKCHDRDGFLRDRDTLLFKKIWTAQNFDVAAGWALAS